ncbi:uncharacterized protein DUF2842 [Rhizobium sp. PP-F2F-G38]|nr:uncharacterized protein DUF2842 [Rhizobium sp. PP-WC-1G-195]PYE99225.1 uncharacterized protein DUF2842 [Rhizobium sp. PP-F2F-G38]
MRHAVAGLPARVIVIAYRAERTLLEEIETMPVRLRKLIGTILIIVLVISYALIATTFAELLLGASPWWVHLLYFFFTGLLWVLPAMLIIKWMEKPAKPRS